MQLQDTDWRTARAAERIGDPSSWTPVGIRFDDGEPTYGVLYYSPKGCYFVPDGSSEGNTEGIQSLLWGPGLIVSLLDDQGDNSIIELAGSQVQIASDHGAALVRLATEGSMPSRSPMVPQQHSPHSAAAPMSQTQTIDAQSAAARPDPTHPATQPPPPIGQTPDQAAPPSPGAAGGAPAGAALQPAEGAEVEKSSGAGKRILLYVLIAVVVAGGGYFAATTLL